MPETLIHRICKNDKIAQKDFYFKYSKQLFNLCYRYVKNEQDAGGIVNTGFYKIFNSLTGFNYINEKSLLTWMRKIIINEALSFLRQRIEYCDIEDKYHNSDIYEFLPETNLILEDYYNLIRQLPDDLRTVFNLYAIDGYSHKEIAEKLDIKESSSRVYLTRARNMLKKCLRDYGKEN